MAVITHQATRWIQDGERKRKEEWERERELKSVDIDFLLACKLDLKVILK